LTVESGNRDYANYPLSAINYPLRMRRPERLAEALREEIAEVVGFELDDPRVEMVTVTEVKVAEDLRDAKVYVLVDGSEDEISKALRALQNAAPFVRQQVSLNLSMRFAPHLHFVRDTAEENASRVSSILSDLTSKGEINEKDSNGE
jgi:ribosome-binding factor A